MPASVARHSNAASLAIPSADSRAAVAHSVRTRLDFLSHSRKCCSMKRHASVLPCNGRRAGASNPASTQLDRLVHYCQSSKVLCTDRSRGLLDWRTNRPAIGSVSCTQHAANRSCATTQTPDTAFSCPELQLSTSRKLCDGCLLPRRALACYFVRFCQIQATQLVCQSGSIGDRSHCNPCTKPWNFDNILALIAQACCK